MKILVNYAYKRSTIDNYNEGEDPDTTQEIDLNIDDKVFESLSELADDLYLPRNKENWCAIEDGRLICTVAEVEDGTEPTDRDMELFKNGEMDLYACEYEFSIKFIDTHTPSMEEIAEKLEIETYD